MISEDPLRTLWHNDAEQPEREPMELLAAAIRRSRCLERRIVRRNAIEYAACAAVAVVFADFARHAGNTLEAAGWTIIVAGAVWIAFWLHRRGSPGPVDDPALSLAAYREHLIAAYDRQIRLAQTVKYWYIAPLYAGLVVALAGVMQQEPGRQPQLLAVLALETAVCAFVWWLNEGYAVSHLRRLRQEAVDWEQEEKQ